MKKFRVYSFFDHRGSYVYGDLRVREAFEAAFESNPIVIFYGHLFDESTTYEEMIRTFTRDGRLLPLDDPRLHYNIVLQAFEIHPIQSFPKRHFDYPPRSLSKPVVFREGQTLASTQLTRLIMDESEYERRLAGHEPESHLYCAISLEIRDGPPPTEKQSSGSPNWVEVTSVVGGVLGVLYGATANAASIVGGLDVIERRWREWRTTHPPIQSTTHPSETDIVAIRLRMTQGPDHEFVEWLTDPDRLKVYIDAFKSSSIKPLQAIFVQRNNKALPVDVLEGAQNNLALDALLSYLQH
jgi:hypothetical protein